MYSLMSFCSLDHQLGLECMVKLNICTDFKGRTQQRKFVEGNGVENTILMAFWASHKIVVFTKHYLIYKDGL